LSREDRDALREENQEAFVNPSELGDPGEKFKRETFLPATQLTFPDALVEGARAVDGVADVAPALSVLLLSTEGTVPDEPGSPERGRPNPADFDIEFETTIVAGVDPARTDIGLVTPAQVVEGRFLRPATSKRVEALLSVAYARRLEVKIGDSVSFGDERVRVVGFVEPPIGGQAADAYVPLDALQKASEREGRVNLLLVRATEAADVGGVAKRVREAVPGAEVSSSQDLADTVSGSLVGAADLSDRLGLALALVALIASFLVAGLLTLSAVNKRVRELGTLRAIGWSRARVVRQLALETLALGLLGGLVGAVLGVGGAALAGALAPDLQASAASAVPQFGRGGEQAPAPDPTTTVPLDAPVDFGLLMAAVGLALLGGLLAAGVAAVRASRLEPADAMRQAE
ncbi:MAG: ABC transporter permease, partial [Solirubrobacterales bacterium]